MRFEDRDLSGVTTVDGLQEAVLAADIDGYDYVVWDDQRRIQAPDATFVVFPVERGYRLTIEERSNVDEVGTYPDQAAVVREVLRRSNPQRRQTPEEAARAAAAGRRATVENAAHRAELDATMHRLWERTMQERKEAALHPDDGTRGGGRV